MRARCRAAARHHPGVQRGGIAARGAQGARRADARPTTCSSCPTARPTAPPSWRATPACPRGGAAVQPRDRRSAADRVLVRGAARATSAPSQFDADGQHDPLAVRDSCSTVSTDGADMVIGSRFAEGGAVTYEVSGHPAPGDEGSCSGWCRCSCANDSPTPAPASARSPARCSSTSPQNYPVEYMDSVEALVQACNAGFRVDEVAANMRGRTGGAPSAPAAQASSTTTCACSSCCWRRPPAAASGRGAPRTRRRRAERMSTEAHILVIALAAAVIAVHRPPRAQSASCARSTRCCGSRSGSVLAVLAVFPTARGSPTSSGSATRRPRSCCWR